MSVWVDRITLSRVRQSIKGGLYELPCIPLQWWVVDGAKCRSCALVHVCGGGGWVGGHATVVAFIE